MLTVSRDVCTHNARKPLESNMTSHTAMDPNATHVHLYYSRKLRAQRIRVMRRRNAAARRLGFKNYQAWQGSDD
jgi:hypothetical protein